MTAWIGFDRMSFNFNFQSVDFSSFLFRYGAQSLCKRDTKEWTTFWLF